MTMHFMNLVRALCLGWVVVGPSGLQAQDDPAPAAPVPAPAVAQQPPTAGILQPAGPERFARQPRTPLEFWDAADYLVRSGQPKVAAPYVDAFLKANPDDNTLLQIRDQFGVGSILRLAEDPATAPFAQPVLDRLQAAVARIANQPERLEGAMQLLWRGGAERQVGLDRLREAGPNAVPAILARLSDPSLDSRKRAVLAEALGRLDTSAVPPLVAALEAPDAVVATLAARALAQLSDARALPALMFPAAKLDESAPLQNATRQAIAAITGRTYEAQPATALQMLTAQAWRYHRHEVDFPSDRVSLWTWLDNAPVPVTLDRADAESELGLVRARQALALDPKHMPAQSAFISLALERAARRHGVAKVVQDDPDGSFATALTTGPAVLGQVLRTAIADRHGELAQLAATALGRVADRDPLGQGGAANPLVAALSAPDRRVQLAAAAALVDLEPEHAFPGSSRLVPTLARFLGSHSARRALVIDGNAARAGTSAGVLNSLGFDTETTASGRAGFLFAADSAGVELILVDPTALQGGWTWHDLLSNLRADARTADIPILLTGTLKEGDKLRPALARYPLTDFTVSPTDPQLFKSSLDRIFGRFQIRAPSDEERARQAALASELLARIASKPNSPFARDLAGAEAALSVALANPASSAGATSALGNIPGADAQRSLAHRLLDTTQDAGARQAAGNQLVRSIQRFGPLLTDSQERRLLDALHTESDPMLHSIYAAVVGALRPDPELTGQRLTK